VQITKGQRIALLERRVRRWDRIIHSAHNISGNGVHTQALRRFLYRSAPLLLRRDTELRLKHFEISSHL
jgi:hypothetical protein